MRGLENQTYLVALLACYLLVLFFLFGPFRVPRLSRLLFFILFSWACWMNWTTAQHSPADYLQYADLTFSGWYRGFINGWFGRHIPLAVGVIATCQGLIALSMLGKGWVFKLGCAGGIIFLLAIAPLGVGSGFPCTLTFALALATLFNKGKDYWWIKNGKLVNVN